MLRYTATPRGLRKSALVPAAAAALTPEALPAKVRTAPVATTTARMRCELKSAQQQVQHLSNLTAFQLK